MEKWISVEDGLPPNESYVLCSGAGQGNRAVFIGYRGMCGNWLEYNNGSYIEFGDGSGGYGDEHPAQVTHWQQLPAPARQSA